MKATNKKASQKLELVCMDTAQWAQGIGVVKKPLMDEGSSSSLMSTRPAAAPPPPSASAQSQSQLVERRTRPVKEQALHCPRCNSTNTKFCYYNNYSLTQPRYICKTCRRYWTEGGSLRNVPVGGGSRKNKRHSSSSASAASSSKIRNMQQPLPAMASLIPIPQISAGKPYQGQDLTLAFPNSTGFPDLIGGGFPTSITGGELTAMELLRNTGITARGLGPLVHMSMAPETGAVYGAGFGLHDFSSPAAGFIGNGNGNFMQEGGGGRLLFPFGELKQVNEKAGNENDDEQNREQAGDHPPFFWTGANLGGGGGGGSW